MANKKPWHWNSVTAIKEKTLGKVVIPLWCKCSLPAAYGNSCSLGYTADASVLNYLPVLNYSNMAKNGKVGDGHRNGQIKDRSQTHNPKTDSWVKRDTDTGRFMDGKSDDKPFKGVRKEN